MAGPRPTRKAAAGDGEFAQPWMRKHIQDISRGYIKFNARCRPPKL